MARVLARADGWVGEGSIRSGDLERGLRSMVGCRWQRRERHCEYGRRFMSFPCLW